MASLIPQKELADLNKNIKERGHVDREHLLKFLTLIPTNDAQAIIREVKQWLEKLHDDPAYSTVVFPKGDIEAVLGDLDSYGRVHPDTINEFKQNSNKALPIT